MSNKKKIIGLILLAIFSYLVFIQVSLLIKLRYCHCQSANLCLFLHQKMLNIVVIFIQLMRSCCLLSIQPLISVLSLD